MRRARGWRGAWPLVVLLAAGCHPRSVVTPVVAEAPKVEPARHVAAESGPRPVAAATAPMQLLPDTTAFMINVAGIGSLLALVDVDEVVARYRPYYEQAAAALILGVGANLLDLTQWSAIGVDPNGPMGVALVDVRGASFVGYVTISDPDRFRGFLDRIAGPARLLPVLEDRGTVLRSDPDGGPAVVLRDGFAFVVGTDRPDEAMYDVARALATVDPARGLVASSRYQQATAGGAPGAGLTAYVDLWALLEGEHAHRGRAAQEPGWAAQTLDSAVATGAPPEVQDQLRRQVDEEREWRRREAERVGQTFELGKRWFGSMSPVVFEFTASRSGVLGTIRAKMPETAPLRASLRNAAEPSPVLMALGERPLLLLGGNLEVPAALAELEALMRVGGDDPNKFYRELGELLKVDVRTELAGALTGGWGFALTASDALMRGEGRGGGRDVGFAVGLGVNDAARAEALLERAWRRLPPTSGKDRATGAHTLEVPGYRTIYARVVAQQLVVTSDVGVIQRVAAGNLRATHKWLEPAVVPVVSARDVAMQGLLDVVAAMVLVSGRTSADDGVEAPPQPYWQFPDVAKDRVDRVPPSRAYKARLREWQALGLKIRKQEQAQRRAQAQVIGKLAQCVGVLAGNLREQPDGLALAGGQLFGPGGLSRAIDLGVEYAGLPGHRDEALMAMMQTREQLAEELRRLRTLDVATALKLPLPPN